MEVAIREQKYRNKIHPKKFALWVSCASIIMMFGAMTSAYIVRQAAGNWLEFRLPNLFFISTVVIVLSSLTLEGSFQAFKRKHTLLYKGLMWATFILGLAFVVLQYQGWVALAANGIELNGNPSGSFVYVISGLHAAHVLGGLAALFVALLHALSLVHKVTKKRLLRFDLTRTYWHFVGVLWVYLIVFFVLQQS
ncbi:MAG: cytochrome c oxidase subunit 3 [Bacteroidota bacterium]